MKLTINIECQECNGNGFNEEMRCTLPASMCCGSCYDAIKCDHCNGEGNYDVEINLQDVKAFVESGEIESERI